MQSIDILIVIILIQRLDPTALWARFALIQNDTMCCSAYEKTAPSHIHAARRF
jgi:hypothetical protein